MLVNLPTEDLLFLKDVLVTYGMDKILSKNCNLVLDRKEEFKEHLIIVLAVPMTKDRRATNHLDLNINLKDVNKTLRI